MGKENQKEMEPVYVLPDTFISDIKNIRELYQKKKNNIKLAEKTDPGKLKKFFYATDVSARNTQIALCEGLFSYMESKYQISALDSKLRANPGSLSDQEKNDYMYVSRILFACTLMINQQILSTYITRSEKNAKLVQVLHDIRKISSGNLIDMRTKACCLLEAQNFLKEVSSQVQPPLPEGLRTHKDAFAEYVKEELEKLDECYKCSYPIAGLCASLLGSIGEISGYTTGSLVGGLVSKSSALMPAKIKIIAALTSCAVLIMGPGATVGVMLLAPTYADCIVTSFTSITLAYVMGKSLKLVGKGVGYTIGFSLDMSIALLCKTCSLICTSLSAKDQDCVVNGYTLTDGMRVEGGELVSKEELDYMVNQQEKNPAPDMVYDEESQTYSIEVEKQKLTISKEMMDTLKQWVDIMQSPPKKPPVLVEPAIKELSLF
ncbi:hypothetical protein ACFORL_11180 [Legionella dresdenensis]|uniref:Substrate of the Dot/Icm secretion system n=1 Tax=Legionella dresdenensis TaxID=450200 RepID=A0ABV8CHC7_9GAMM